MQLFKDFIPTSSISYVEDLLKRYHAIGAKMACPRVLEQLILSAEIGSRYVFSDNIDGSLSNTENYTNFGNINNRDWYVFSLINLSYTFGRKPCYCNY